MNGTDLKTMAADLRILAKELSKMSRQKRAWKPNDVNKLVTSLMPLIQAILAMLVQGMQQATTKE